MKRTTVRWVTGTSSGGVKNAYRGDGKYAQLCVIMPDQNAVVASRPTQSGGRNVDIVFDLLVPKMQDALLPENPEGVMKLRDFESRSSRRRARPEVSSYLARSTMTLDQICAIVYLPNG